MDEPDGQTESLEIIAELSDRMVADNNVASHSHEGLEVGGTCEIIIVHEFSDSAATQLNGPKDQNQKKSSD